jgi:hypothetical protein
VGRAVCKLAVLGNDSGVVFAGTQTGSRERLSNFQLKLLIFINSDE